MRLGFGILSLRGGLMTMTVEYFEFMKVPGTERRG